MTFLCSNGLANDSSANEQEVETCKQVHIFYYPWYGNPESDGQWFHWDQGEIPQGKGTIEPRKPPEDIGASYYPEMGLYSSRSEKDIEKHVQQIRRAGVGVISLSWWGQGSYSDQAVPKVLDVAADYGVHANFHVEPYPGRTALSTRGDIRYIVEKYGSHQAFYRNSEHGNKPLFYVYDPYHTPSTEWATILSPTAETTIRGTDFDSIVISLFLDKSFEKFVLGGHFDGFYTYFAVDGFVWGSTLANWPEMAEFAREQSLLFIPCVGPGYDDLRVRPWNTVNVRTREHGQYYDKMFEAALALKPEIVSVTSFDEWHEGTQIAPAVPKKIDEHYYLDYLPNGPDFYLEKTREWVEKFQQLSEK